MPAPALILWRCCGTKGVGRTSPSPAVSAGASRSEILSSPPMPDLATLLQTHPCADATEAGHRDRMLWLLQEKENCFWRSCFPAHFTASALVLSADGERTLLTHHHFLDRWLQFGGHCDGEADLLQAALREAREESGIEELTAPLDTRPVDLDIHPIPASPKRGEPAHEHFDVRYVLIAPPRAEPRISSESKELRWFTPEEMLAVNDEPGLRRLVEKWKQRQTR